MANQVIKISVINTKVKGQDIIGSPKKYIQTVLIDSGKLIEGNRKLCQGGRVGGISYSWQKSGWI